MKINILKFFNDLLTDDNNKSSKRFVTLIITLHFIISSFLVLFLFGFLVFRTTKGDIVFLKPIIDIFKIILEYDFFIILGGLGFLTMKDFANAFVQKAGFKSGIFPSNNEIITKEE